MKQYYVITAEQNGECKTALVLKEELEGGSMMQDFFTHDATDHENHGLVSIEGVAEDYISDYLTDA